LEKHLLAIERFLQMLRCGPETKYHRPRADVRKRSFAGDIYARQLLFALDAAKCLLKKAIFVAGRTNLPSNEPGALTQSGPKRPTQDQSAAACSSGSWRQFNYQPFHFCPNSTKRHANKVTAANRTLLEMMIVLSIVTLQLW
jgi:hypothetical protein